MSHGFLGIKPMGMVFMAASTGFLWFLSTSFKGPEGPKYSLDPFIVDVAKEYQPGLQAEHYYKK